MNRPLIITLIVLVLIIIGFLIFLALSGEKEGDELNNNNAQTYNCSSDIYNCADFETPAEAQAVFDYCNPTAGDVHQLDNGGDGKVCESLA